VAAPVFNPSAGTYASAQSVTLTDTTAGASIYYTTNGSTPTTASTAYTAAIPVSATTTVKAFATAAGGTSSPVASATYTINLPAAATPTFSPATGTYTSAQSVSISDATAGAIIYYTTDGTVPSTSSFKYTAPITVSATTTLNAIATASGFSPSAVGTAAYTISFPAAATPAFSLAAGTYTSAQSVRISDSTAGATIYYTTDNSTPTTSSSRYTAAIPVTTTTTIKAIATATSYTSSAAASAAYTINIPVAATPTFSPGTGTFTSAQSVTIADTTAGATIYYTTDSSPPTTSSTKYTAAIPVSATTTIKAIATAANYTNSAVASAIYTINKPVVATPTFTPAAGAYLGAQSVTLSDATTGASIYYTTDGVTTPTTASTLYTGPITVSSTTTIQAIATLAGDTNSAVIAGTFTISSSAPAPSISPAGGNFTSAPTVTLNDTAANAVLYYTLDGTTPTSSSTKYTAPFPINAAGSTVVSAIAVVPGVSNSSVAAQTFTIRYPPSFQPTYSYKNVQIVGGGFVDGLYFHPQQKGLMYAHTDIGGAYRWNNVAGGDTQWVPLNDSIGAFNSGFDLAVQSLAIDPNDTSRLYLAMGAYTESYGSNGAILYSSDMGTTFTAVSLPFKNGGNDSGRNAGDRLEVDPNNGKHLYLGTIQNGLYESVDRALTWDQVSAFPITGLGTNPEDPESGILFEQFLASSGTAANGNTKTVYYGVTSPTVGLYVSQDGGVTFTPVPGQPTGYYPNAESLDTTNNILYVTYSLTTGCTSNCDNVGPGGPNAGQVWSYKLPTSQVPNGTWTNITPPQTTPTGGAYGWDSVVVDPSHPNVIMVTTLNKYYPDPGDDIFRSADSGATWYNIGSNEVRDISLAPWMAPFQPGNWLCHLVVDPFDSNHAMYGNGQNIWVTFDLQDADGVATSMTTSVHGNKTTWSIGAQGLEETAILQLVSPPSGPAHLFSEVGDLGGFTHTDLDVSPSNAQQHPPLFTTGTDTDFAQNKPLYVARVGSSNGTAGTFNQPSGSLHGGYSTDGGITWTQFATEPAGITTGAGSIGVSTDGSTIVWMPADSALAAQYSTDNGTTWTASTGGPAQTSNGNIGVAADRFNAKKFYLFDSTDNSGYTPLYISLDGGHTFASASSPKNYDTGFAVSTKAEGDLWLFGYNGLYHSTDSGTTITQVPGIDQAFGIGFGAPAPGYSTPAIYLVGHATADTTCVPNTPNGFTVQSQCVYRSVDGGQTFVLINDFNHQYGSFHVLAGDPRVFGRVYFGTGGRGIIEADSPN
jgi:hypothetical protein